MNQLFVTFGVEAWKPLIGALLLPPVPLLLLALIGTRLVFWRRWLGWLVVLAAALLIGLLSTTGFARFAEQQLLKPPPAYSADQLAALAKRVKDRQPVAIVVLGGGARPYAPEYRVSNLGVFSLERLRYGVWLSRQTGAPVAFSGGVGFAARAGTLPEAEIAGRIAAEEFGRPLRWTEARSRDTHENAAYTVAMLRDAGIRQIVLVTHAMHMPRSLRNFERAAGGTMAIEAAPVDVPAAVPDDTYPWLPSSDGLRRSRDVLREALGLLAGA